MVIFARALYHVIGVRNMNLRYSVVLRMRKSLEGDISLLTIKQEIIHKNLNLNLNLNWNLNEQIRVLSITGT